MYVCLCHGITDREIRRQSTTTSCSVSDVYQARGVAPKCGKCVSLVRAILREARRPPDENREASFEDAACGILSGALA